MAKFGPKIFLDRQIMINAGDFNVTCTFKLVQQRSEMKSTAFVFSFNTDPIEI